MRIFAASFLLAVTGICFAESTPDTAPVPRKAPEFVFNMQDGSQMLLSSHKGKAVVISFMFTTCPHCQALCPTLATIQKEYQAKGVEFIGDVIDEGAKAGLPEFTKSYSRGAFPVGWSTQGAALEFLKHPDPHYYVPMLVFIDKKGMIQSQYIGDNDFLKEPEKNIRTELDKILSGSPVGPKAAAKTITKSVESKMKSPVKK